jgi:hypothetical protein
MNIGVGRPIKIYSELEMVVSHSISIEIPISSSLSPMHLRTLPHLRVIVRYVATTSTQ